MSVFTGLVHIWAKSRLKSNQRVLFRRLLFRKMCVISISDKNNSYYKEFKMSPNPEFLFEDLGWQVGL